MAGFGKNDEAVSGSKVKSFGANDEVVSEPKEVQAQGHLTHPPTTLDRISTEMNQGGKALDPEQIIKGVGSSVSRSANAFANLRKPGSSFSDVVDSVPLVGPIAHDAYTKITTPGQRVEGFTDLAMMGLPLLSEMAPAAIESSARPMSAVSGGVRGGLKSAVAPIEYGMHRLPVPASIAGGAAGHFAGSPFGDIGSAIGAVMGAGAPFVRGAIEGGKRALSLYDIQHMPPSELRPVFDRPDWIPPVIERAEPLGSPGSVLPSGSVVGPAPPSRTNPPVARGNAPRIPGWQRAGIQVSDSAPIDASPIYPASPILESGHVIGPRPSLTGMSSSPGVVQNGPRVPVAEPIDTPATVRDRANQSRAKFDENGKRNQLKK